jgi:hypothetical protein
MSIKIYKDDAANAIFLETITGVQFINSLQATVTNGLVNINDLAKGFAIVSNTTHSDFIRQDGTSYGADAVAVCNELNAIFSSTGSAGQEVPEITSSTSVALTTGDNLNYELVALRGVGYEWANLPAGVTTVEGSVRNLIGGTSLSPGTYSPTATAINYAGFDQQTITITVSDPPFSATKSVQFNSGASTNDYASGSASDLNAVLGRAAATGNSWTVGFWIKPTNNGNSRCIMYAGASDKTNGGGIEFRLTSANKLRVRIGSNFNNLLMTTQNTLTHDVWQYVDIRYDGGTTGSSSGSLNNYYSRFTVTVDNAAQTMSNNHTNNGWGNAITVAVFELGRFVNSTPLNGEKLCQFAVFDSDSDATTAELYNSGSPFDLNTLTNGPSHWWKMGDGDTFSTLIDHAIGGNTDLTMNNMTIADIVTDSP